ncbi:MAG: metallophosphoesterase [Candidatus Moranbacteria bacterium]|nr:metallophosphoesterase [Candidatus Moranbacteria bacterium]
MLISIVLLGILLLYGVAHGIVFFSLVKFFGITNLLYKNILLSVIFFLGLSFFISSIFGHIKDSLFTRDYYFLSGAWVGFMWNMVLFFVLVWVVVLLGQKLGFAANQKILATLAIMAACAYSAYGVWNAFNPKITSLSVAIDDLPEEWVGKKIVQISDLHLGNIYHADYLTSVVEKINALNPDVVVITGDLFDGSVADLNVLLKPIDRINAKVFFVTGNHETFIGLDKVYAAISLTKIIPLRDASKNIGGLQFVGIDYPLRGNDRDISKIIPAMAGWDQFAPSILLIHEPVQIENAKKIGISLQLSGHTHRGQLFPFGFITSLIFKGYDHGFKRDGSFAIYTSSGLGGWGPPMRTENRSEIVEITLK